MSCATFTSRIFRCTGLRFTPNTASNSATKGRLFAAADAGHMEGKSKESYGTFFELSAYDANMHLNSIATQHSVGNESRETWDECFGAAAAVHGFDRQGRTIAVDMEKSIGVSARKIFALSRRFDDKRHL